MVGSFLHQVTGGRVTLRSWTLEVISILILGNTSHRNNNMAMVSYDRGNGLLGASYQVSFLVFHLSYGSVCRHNKRLFPSVSLHALFLLDGLHFYRHTLDVLVLVLVLDVYALDDHSYRIG